MPGESRPYWTFKQYPISANNGAITKWLRKCKQVDGSAEIEFDTTIKTLAAIKNRQLWLQDRKLFKKMASWEDIYEVRFENAAGSPLRVFGFFRDEEREFVMLGGAVEDNQKYEPPDIRNICVGRRKDILQGRDTPIDFNFEDEVTEDDNDDEYIKALFR